MNFPGNVREFPGHSPIQHLMITKSDSIWIFTNFKDFLLDDVRLFFDSFCKVKSKELRIYEKVNLFSVVLQTFQSGLNSSKFLNQVSRVMFCVQVA